MWWIPFLQGLGPEAEIGQSSFATGVEPDRSPPTINETTTSNSDATNMTTETALMMGVTPLRMRLKTRTGSVVAPGPAENCVTTTSSSDKGGPKALARVEREVRAAAERVGCPPLLGALLSPAGSGGR